MKRAITENRTANLYLIHYDLPRWRVLTLILIPHFAFYLSANECRKTLALTARRAGWIGCNILLSQIPTGANLTVESKAWTLDVLNVVRSFNKTSFVLADV
jgi:type II restriction enzyme